MFKRKNRAASAAPAPDNVTVLDGSIMYTKKPGPIKCALLALRDWVLYYAIMIAIGLAIRSFVGDLVDLVLAALIQPPVAYLIGRRLMKQRPVGTVYKIPRSRTLLLALAYAAIAIPAKIADHSLSMVAGGSYGGPMVEMLMLVLVAPVSEELLYRGVLFPLAERRTGFWPAAVMNAVVFALAHFPNVRNMASAFVMSLSVCALQSTTGRTRYCILVHWVFNALTIPLAIADPTMPVAACMAALAASCSAQLAFCVKRETIAEKLIPGWK